MRMHTQHSLVIAGARSDANRIMLSRTGRLRQLGHGPLRHGAVVRISLLAIAPQGCAATESHTSPTTNTANTLPAQWNWLLFRTEFETKDKVKLAKVCGMHGNHAMYINSTRSSSSKPILIKTNKIKQPMHEMSSCKYSHFTQSRRKERVPRYSPESNNTS